MPTQYIRHNVTLLLRNNPEAKKFLTQEIGNQRFIWNYMVAANKARYESEKKFIFGYEMTMMLPELKKRPEMEFLRLGSSWSLQQTIRRLDQTLNTAIRKKGQGTAGFPKFHRKSSGGSVVTSGKIVGDLLFIPKLKVGMKMHLDKRGAPTNFKSVTIKLLPSGKFIASFVTTMEIPDLTDLTPDSKAVGIDFNSRHLMVTSSGQAIENRKLLKKHEARLKRYQRKMSRRHVRGGVGDTKRQSKNYEKARKKYAREYERITNKQGDFIHQMTSDIVDNYDIIVLEDLNVKAMQKWNGRMIQMAPFGRLRSVLTWKANKSGKHIVIINRWEPTSKVCHSCGQVHKMDLSIRWLSCDCGAEMHRDHNAAKNILAAGLRQIHTAGTAGINVCRDVDHQFKMESNLRSDWTSMVKADKQKGGTVRPAEVVNLRKFT